MGCRKDGKVQMGECDFAPLCKAILLNATSCCFILQHGRMDANIGVLTPWLHGLCKKRKCKHWLWFDQCQKPITLKVLEIPRPFGLYYRGSVVDLSHYPIWDSSQTPAQKFKIASRVKWKDTKWTACSCQFLHKNLIRLIWNGSSMERGAPA